MATKRNDVEMEYAINASISNKLKSPLLESVKQDLWMETLCPLQWVLLPVGITNLFPDSMIQGHSANDKKIDNFWKIWSWIVGLAIVFLFPIYEMIFRFKRYTMADDGMKLCLILISTATFMLHFFLFLFLFVYNFYRCSILGTTCINWCQFSIVFKQFIRLLFFTISLHE